MTAGSSCERGARVRFPPPLIFLSSIVVGVVLQYTVAAAPVPIDRVIRIIGGLILIGAGIGLVVSARILFLRTGQSPTPWKPTPELILKGPYRLTRNPMYLGVTLFVIGLGVAVNDLWISVFAVVALSAVHIIAVRPEERYLSEKFGASYRAYLTQVRRYL